MKQRLIFAVLGAFFCAALTAQVPDAGPPSEPEGAAAWKSLGPMGGEVTALVVNPSNPNEVFAVSASSQGQIFRSKNGGVSWTRLAFFDEEIYALALTPGNPNVMYALAYNKVYKSLNKGVKWTAYQLGDYKSSYGGDIYVSPANPSIVIVAGSRTYQTSPDWLYCMAIHRSTNGGVTWTSTSLQPNTDYAYMHHIAGNAAQPQTLYASGYGHRSSGITTYYIFKSKNNGATWTKIAEPISQATKIVVHPADANRVWYSSGNGVFRSADGGSSWQPGNGYIYAMALAQDRNNPQTLYAGSSPGFYRSEDGGLNWTASATPPPGTARRILVNGSAILCGTSGGIYRSANSGTSFAASQGGYKASDITALASAPSAPATMFAESSGVGFYKSTNAGTAWKALPYFYRCEAVLKIFVEPSNWKQLFILAGG